MNPIMERSTQASNNHLLKIHNSLNGRVKIALLNRDGEHYSAYKPHLKPRLPVPVHQAVEMVRVPVSVCNSCIPAIVKRGTGYFRAPNYSPKKCKPIYTTDDLEGAMDYAQWLEELHKELFKELADVPKKVKKPKIIRTWGQTHYKISNILDHTIGYILNCPDKKAATQIAMKAFKSIWNVTEFKMKNEIVVPTEYRCTSIQEMAKLQRDIKQTINHPTTQS